MGQNDKEWQGRTRGGFFGYKFFILLIKFLGIRAAYIFLGLVVVYFIPFAPKATRATWKYARQILRYGRLRSFFFLFLSYYRFGQTLIDKVAINSGYTEDYNFQFDDTLHNLLDTLDSDQGVILIGAHVGNWEIGAPFFDEYGKKMHVVLFDDEYQKIKDLLASQRKELNYQIIPVNKDDLSHIFEITDALNKKEYVCFQGDRFVKDTKTFRMEFMGREADFPAGPFILGARMKVPVVFYFAIREKNMQYHFLFEPANSEKDLLTQYIASLESVIREHPEQWFNYYDFWK